MPQEAAIQFQMQALELKPTDLWAYLTLPHNFVETWSLVAGVIAEYRQEMMESAS